MVGRIDVCNVESAGNNWQFGCRPWPGLLAKLVNYLGEAGPWLAWCNVGRMRLLERPDQPSEWEIGNQRPEHKYQNGAEGGDDGKTCQAWFHVGIHVQQFRALRLVWIKVGIGDGHQAADLYLVGARIRCGEMPGIGFPAHIKRVAEAGQTLRGLVVLVVRNSGLGYGMVSLDRTRMQIG